MRVTTLHGMWLLDMSYYCMSNSLHTTNQPCPLWKTVHWTGEFFLVFALVVKVVQGSNKKIEIFFGQSCVISVERTSESVWDHHLIYLFYFHGLFISFKFDEKAIKLFCPDFNCVEVGLVFHHKFESKNIKWPQKKWEYIW